MRKLTILLVLAAVVLAGAAPGAVATASAQLPLLEDNPWLERGMLNIAHRGGAHEAPENTLFAYHHALDSGAHVLEMDVYQTADGELVAIHDATVNRTTNGSGAISDLTLEQVQSLDGAYWFVDGHGARRDEPDDAYRLRGIATGDADMPDDLAASGAVPDDFRIPTLREVLERFPGVFKVIELKPDPAATGQFEAQLADLLAEFDRTDDVIVASFLDHHLELFKLAAPNVHTSYPLLQVALQLATSVGPLPGLPNRHHAFQVPIEFEFLPIVNQQFVDDAHNLNVAVHVWTINDCQEMMGLLDLGVDGIMTDVPSLLADLLDQPAATRSCDAVDAAAGTNGETGAPDGESTPASAASGESLPALPRTGGQVPLGAAFALVLATVLLRYRPAAPPDAGEADRVSA